MLQAHYFMHHFYLDGTTIEISTIANAIEKKLPVALSETTRSKIKKNRSYLEEKISNSDQLIYGINTGFGSLCNVAISDENLKLLQRNLVLSHACGLGDFVPEKICATIHLLKIINLAQGYSGVRLLLVEKLIALYNCGITPVIYQQGSLGASGDLAPLAHLALPLLGLGKVYYNGVIVESETALKAHDIEPLVLESKEGLALLNGTQFSLAYALHIVVEAKKTFHLSNRIAALSIAAYHVDMAPFNALIHQIRPHTGQILSAAEIFELLSSGETQTQKKESVQDPYSFRCVPQVHGASFQAIAHAMEVVKTELNAVTDNPNVFDQADCVLSGGNFHAQPLALVLDYLAIAIAEFGSISERRIYQLINGDRGLPVFLTKHAGLQSGFMIVQYTAASIVSQNKQYCTPASVDSIISSKGQEDHVSMAANAATKAFRVLKNSKSVLALEAFTASQAIDFRKPMSLSPVLETMMAQIRAVIPFLEEDMLMHDEFVKAEALLDRWLLEMSL